MHLFVNFTFSLNGAKAFFIPKKKSHKKFIDYKWICKMYYKSTEALKYCNRWFMVQTAINVSLGVQIAINWKNKLYHKTLRTPVFVYFMCVWCVPLPQLLIFVWIGLVGNVMLVFASIGLAGKLMLKLLMSFIDTSAAKTSNRS